MVATKRALRYLNEMEECQSGLKPGDEDEFVVLADSN